MDERLSSNLQKKLIKQIKSIPGNEKCVECEQRDPTWASINLGILICIHCSGVHRSFGTSISQVRSVDMDVWKVEWIKRLKRIGNTKSLKEWEGKLKNNEKYKYIKGLGIEKFLKEKYINKKWRKLEIDEKQEICSEKKIEQKNDKNLSKNKNKNDINDLFIQNFENEKKDNKISKDCFDNFFVSEKKSNVNKISNKRKVEKNSFDKIFEEKNSKDNFEILFNNFESINENKESYDIHFNKDLFGSIKDFNKVKGKGNSKGLKFDYERKGKIGKGSENQKGIFDINMEPDLFFDLISKNK